MAQVFPWLLFFLQKETFFANGTDYPKAEAAYFLKVDYCNVSFRYMPALRAVALEKIKKVLKCESYFFSLGSKYELS